MVSFLDRIRPIARTDRCPLHRDPGPLIADVPCLGKLSAVNGRRKLDRLKSTRTTRSSRVPRSSVPSRSFSPNTRRHQDGQSAGWSGIRAAILRRDNASLSVVLIEKVGVRPGADQMQLVSLGEINQQPVGLDMKLPVTFPDPPQRMIAIVRGQRFLSDQCRQRGPQLGQVLAPPLRSPHVALELRGPDRDQHISGRCPRTTPRRCRSACPCRRRVPSWL